jgi:hypothetical protein
MRRALYLWLCGLGLGLLLACNGDEDDTAPEPPRWGEDTPVFSNQNPVRVRLYAEPGSEVRIYFDYCKEWDSRASAYADENGIAVLEVKVNEPTYISSTTKMYARAMDAAGNRSNCSVEHEYKLDNKAPEKPEWVSGLPTLSNLSTLTLKVRATAGTLLTLHGTANCSGAPLATVTAIASENLFTLELKEDAQYTFTARAMDEVNNASCSSPHLFLKDSRAPAPPVLRSLPASPSPDDTPELEGLTEPGAEVFLYETEGCLGSAPTTKTADTVGKFSFPRSVARNTASPFSVEVMDKAKNRSECATFTYVHDNISPVAPVFQGFTPASPSNHNAPVFAGRAEPGAHVRIFASDSCQGPPVSTAMVEASGRFQASLTVLDDTHNPFSAYVVDAAGNVSSCMFAGSYREDSTEPGIPSPVSVSPASPSNVNALTVAGTAEEGATALLYATPDCQGAVVATETIPSRGAFNLNARVPDDSTTSLSLRIRDAAGNTSACAGPWTYVEDSTPPLSHAATVTDGAGADLGYQLVGDRVEAHWEGFIEAVTYVHVLAAAPGCEGGTRVTEPQTVAAPSVRITGLNLLEDTYFHCVRARDAAGNEIAWVGSDGFRVDLEAPRVVDTTPAPNAADVDILAPISLGFSESVDPSTVTAESLSVTINGVPVAGAVACDGSRVCTFTPAGPLPYLEPVDVALAATVKDRAGRALRAPHALSFTTRGRQWSARPALVQASRPGLSPDVAVDGQGRVLAVWVQGVGDVFRPYAASYTPYVGWGAPQQLDTINEGDAEQPAVAMNAAGRAVAVWVLRKGSQADLYAAEYAPGGGWSTPQKVESRTEPVSAPRVAVDGAGNGLAVWKQSDGTAESLWAARLVVGVGWSAPLLLETGASHASVPALAAMRGGEALVAWTQPDTEGAVQVWASRFTPDTGWTAPEVAAGTKTEAPVAAALSLDGSATILFRRPVGPDAVISTFAARYAPGSGWSETSTSLGPALARTEELSVAMDRWGRALAAWVGPRGGISQTLYVQRFTLEGGWTRMDITRGSSGQPMVAADGQGNFHVLWVENLSGTDRVMQVRSPEGSIGLGAPQVLEPEHSGTSKRPRVATNTVGAAAVVWFRDNGTGFFGNLVYANLYQ